MITVAYSLTEELNFIAEYESRYEHSVNASVSVNALHQAAT